MFNLSEMSLGRKGRQRSKNGREVVGEKEGG